MQLRAWLTGHDFPADTRLPPERELCKLLGVSRGELRKALAALEAGGQLWRHVGKGTFVGTRQIEAMCLAEIDRATNPREVMRNYRLDEQARAREAALNATSLHVDGLRRCLERTHKATTWRQYETADNELHRRISEAANNHLLLVRRAVVWGLLRSGRDRPPPRTIIPLPSMPAFWKRSKRATSRVRAARCICTCARSSAAWSSRTSRRARRRSITAVLANERDA